MMELRAFTPRDHKYLINWINSEKLNYQWGGPTFRFPLDNTQLNQHYTQANVFPFIFTKEGKAVGYVELVQVSEELCRICRVFVPNHVRGNGIAKLMLKQLIKQAKERHHVKTLSLLVFETNTIAKRCYESLGFVAISHEKGTQSWDGELWNLLTMEKSI
ncbi:GNAT family N-acetyltransferase [Vibrio sp. Of14-4]|uniref:GNAT family N-acetyltransferase n=1 Tax=Vibrio sp. Of14-4 TaxID=2724878 RepID=UPI0031BB3A8B